MKKKILSFMLAMLIVLSCFSLYAFADDPVDNATEPSGEREDGAVNIASQAELSAKGEGTDSSRLQLKALVDGNKSNGTRSPKANYYTYIFDFGERKFFTEVVLVVNGSGTLEKYNAPAVELTYNIKNVTVTFYKDGDVTKEFKNVDTSKLEELVLTSDDLGGMGIIADKIEIYVPKSYTARNGNDYMWEVETYAKDLSGGLCDVQLHNVAKEAVFSYNSGIPDDPETVKTDETQLGMWWAVNWAALVDGDPETGTHSPKIGKFSFTMQFTKDYLISEIVFACNGKGFLDDGSFIKVDDYAFNNTQTRFVLYNMEGEEVYDSKEVSVSGLEAKVDPYVEACKIEVFMYNGQYSGNEFMWEIETNIESGEHRFEVTDEKNPTCDDAGYIERSCHCNKVVRKNVPATGFHLWDDGVILEGNEPTADTNGIITKTCTLCGSTGEFDVPATGSHNWDNGTVVAPDCENDGYTIYTCQDPDCGLSYKTNEVQKLGHDWDNGEIIEPAKVGVEGKKLVKCMRDGCAVSKTVATRALNYFDSTTQFDYENNKTDVTVNYSEKPVTQGSGPYEPDNADHPVLKTPEDIAKMFDGDMNTYWYATDGTTVVIDLDKEYYFTAGEVYAAGNFAWLDINFYAPDSSKADGWAITSFRTPAINNGMDMENLAIADMGKVLSNGVRATRIVIEVIGAKWANGHAVTYHEIKLKVHDCDVTEDNYILDATDSRYHAPTCTADGSTVAICPVCAREVEVTLPSDKFGHDYDEENIIVITEPTCISAGEGKVQCKNCSDEITGIVIPATGEHDYTKERVYMEAQCGFGGVKQIICSAEGCERVHSQSPIAPTGNHKYDWVVKSPTTYTERGTQSWECVVCQAYDYDKYNGEKLEDIPAKEIENDFLACDDVYALADTIVLAYTLKLDYLPEVEYECDVRIITYITDENGNETTIESYGKYSKNEYNEETGAFTVEIAPSSTSAEIGIRTVVRLMNFRGVVFVDVPLDISEIDANSNGLISIDEINAK